MARDKIIVVRGELNWAKIVGPARPHTGQPKYDKGPKWSVDITPNADSRKIIKAVGIEDKLRTGKGEKETRKETFLTLSQLENKPDGTKNKPPKISDARGQPWNGDELGNGTIADIKIKVKDYGTTTGVYMQEVRILRHVPYEGGSGFEPLSPDDEFFGADGEDVIDSVDTKGHSGNIDDLDDDVPF